MKFIGTAPVRISLCNGGDTDYYIESMGWGNLINTTLLTHGYRCVLEPKKQNIINYKYINKFHNKNSDIKIKTLNENIEHTEIIRSVLNELYPTFKGNITVNTNVPEKSGLGGSSSLTVSIIKAILNATNARINPEKVAHLAYRIEREILSIKGGYQDQWAAAFGGGVNYLEFRKNKNIFIEPLWLHEDLMQYLESHIILFYIEPRKGNSGDTHEQLEISFKKKKKESLSIMLKRRDNVVKTRNRLLNGDINTFASLLNEEQKRKEALNSKTTTAKSKLLYDTAMDFGAIAGKISGTGEGGCAFFICEPKYQPRVIKKLVELGADYLPMKLERLNKMGVI